MYEFFDMKKAILPSYTEPAVINENAMDLKEKALKEMDLNNPDVIHGLVDAIIDKHKRKPDSMVLDLSSITDSEAKILIIYFEKFSEMWLDKPSGTSADLNLLRLFDSESLLDSCCASDDYMQPLDVRCSEYAEPDERMKPTLDWLEQFSIIVPKQDIQICPLVELDSDDDPPQDENNHSDTDSDIIVVGEVIVVDLTSPGSPFAEAPMEVNDDFRSNIRD